MLAEPLPPGVRVADFGIRGVHLAYELLDGWDAAILVDAVEQGGEPGSLYVIEPDPADPEDGSNAQLGLMDAHDMDPQAVLGLVQTLGGTPAKVLVVGCEPARVDARMGLSEPVALAVDGAIRLVRELVDDAIDEAAAQRGRAGHQLGKEGA
jgi:hydrogenase maturation protease